MAEASAQLIQKIDKNFYSQGVAIKNSKNQIGQIVMALSKRPPRTLSSDTKTNLKRRVKVITTHSGVLIPEINVKRSNEKVHSTSEEHLDELAKLLSNDFSKL